MLKYVIKGTLVWLLGASVLTAVPLAQAAQWLVVEAQDVELAPGTLLVEQQQVTLAEGARLVLLANNGQVLKLQGPYSGIPAETGASFEKHDNLVVIASLLQGHSQPTATLGALRTGSSKRAPAGAVNVDRPGKQCVSSDPVLFWRGNATSQESLTVADAWGKPLVNLTWTMGAAQIEVSASYFNDGQDYWIQRRGGRQVKLQIRKPAQPMDNRAALVAWMAENGCKEQALSLLSNL